MLTMEKELLSEPEIIPAAISANKNAVQKIANEVKLRGINGITIIARGSSLNAGICFKYAEELLCGIPCNVAYPSVVTMFGGNVNYRNSLVIAISQSGMSKDTLQLITQAKQTGAYTVAVTNEAQSPVTQVADEVLLLSAGKEESVAATKTFAAEIAVLYQLAFALAGNDSSAFFDAIPEKLREVIAINDAVADVANGVMDENYFTVLTRGTTQGVGKELALKLGECCYLYGMFFTTADYMHGPLALLDENAKLILLAPSGKCESNFTDIAKTALEKGAKVYAFTDVPALIDMLDERCVVKMPSADKFTAPLTYAMAIHLFCLNLAKIKGINTDSPRNLKKVTVTL